MSWCLLWKALKMVDFAAERYTRDAWAFWDRFYKLHQSNFFKDRHYLGRECPDLLDGPKVILEVLCLLLYCDWADGNACEIEYFILLLNRGFLCSKQEAQLKAWQNSPARLANYGRPRTLFSHCNLHRCLSKLGNRRVLIYVEYSPQKDKAQNLLILPRLKLSKLALVAAHKVIHFRFWIWSGHSEVRLTSLSYHIIIHALWALHLLIRFLPIQVGCGVGNTAFPILARNEEAFVHACDFAPEAVRCLKQHCDYDPKRVNAFVCDFSKESLSKYIQPASVDVCTMIFVLSAIQPAEMIKVDLSNFPQSPTRESLKSPPAPQLSIVRSVESKAIMRDKAKLTQWKQHETNFLQVAQYAKVWCVVVSCLAIATAPITATP